MGTSDTVPPTPDIPEPEIGQRVRHASGWTGRVRAYSQADRAVQVQWDDPTCEPTADADGCSWHHANWLTAISEQDPSCTGCGRPIHRIHGMWLDDLDAGHCPSGAKRGLNGHKPPADVPESSTCTACGGTIRYLGAWVDEDGRGYCPQASAGHELTARPLAVYVIEQRTNLAAGGHAFQLLAAGFAHPSAANAQATVEYMAGAMRWNDRLEGRQPGDRMPLYRIVEVPLATTERAGGA